MRQDTDLKFKFLHLIKDGLVILSWLMEMRQDFVMFYLMIYHDLISRLVFDYTLFDKEFIPMVFD